MSIGTFTKLVNKVRAKLSAPFPKKGRAGGTVQPELQLAIALRWFAGGQMLDVAPLHGVAWNTAWVYVHRVMDAVNSTFNINFGTDVEELKRRAAEFFELSKSTVDGCVGALDGIVFKMKKPRRRDIGQGNVEENVGNYWCRKGFYGVAMQAIVDAKLRFLWLGGFAAGCTNDVHAFGMTQLAEALQKGILPAGFWLAGDEAYVCTDSLIVPYQQQSRLRDERQLRRLQLLPQQDTHHLIRCCWSHNFIIDEEDRDSALPETHVHRRADGATVVDGGGSPVVWLNSFRCSRSLDGAVRNVGNRPRNQGRRSDLGGGLRDRLRDAVVAQGLCRPARRQAGGTVSGTVSGAPASASGRSGGGRGGRGSARGGGGGRSGGRANGGRAGRFNPNL
ncbi:hypothetical protein RI054_45g154850 [Pseudoscourfieldia marina]